MSLPVLRGPTLGTSMAVDPAKRHLSGFSGLLQHTGHKYMLLFKPVYWRVGKMLQARAGVEHAVMTVSLSLSECVCGDSWFNL